MKSVLISIQPKWCELIASGKKTIEMRKTAPKLETPFKCYIYMTATKERCRFLGMHNRLPKWQRRYFERKSKSHKQAVNEFAEDFHEKCRTDLKNLIWEYGEGAGDVIRIFDELLKERYGGEE